jgi:segregation and condensation protein B
MIEMDMAPEMDIVPEIETTSQIDTILEKETFSEKETLLGMEILSNQETIKEFAKESAKESLADLEVLDPVQLESIIESLLFTSDRPVSLARLKDIFEGTQVTTEMMKVTLEKIKQALEEPHRGLTLEEVAGGFQLRTKRENQKFLQRSQKNKPFRLSGPALEVLSIVAYKQPLIKSEIDQIRGVESGHLLRALMEKGLIQFGGKSDFPGRPLLYETTRKFLEVFSLRHIKELPTLSQIDELLPEGIDEVEADRKEGLGHITNHLGQHVGESYSDGEEELLSITEDLQEISTSSEFFELEKKKQQQAREEEKARDLREALMVGESLSTRDLNWLKRYEESLNSVIQ